MDYFDIVDVPIMSIPDFPSVDELTIISLITYFFDLIVSIIKDIGSVVLIIYNLFAGLNSYICDMVTGINSGNYADLPLVSCIGAYRYLVGDVAFYLTYGVIVIGCCMTIYKLISLIVNRYMSMKNTASSAKSGSFTFGGLISGLVNFLK